MKNAVSTSKPATDIPSSGRRRAVAALQVFAGGACYGAMATTYKLAYAAGFTSAQVVASQAWFGCLFFILATIVQLARGRHLARLEACRCSSSWDSVPSRAPRRFCTAMP